nr:PREDICTED: pleckstrin homology domain-containing family M member 3-like [Latimeria chalumnae]XP_014339278.1 PREDICTED: pleckstrin homology domain-containing family M member 3-like [Latimeria chalumnae]|eukprot:XP_006013361.1 PREDICTED: pleckstrin homology domain-containing family M member 3-like [Latimeria chalumnae]
MMEALEVEDISPALEATEDFFSVFGNKLDGRTLQQEVVYGIQEVSELVGHEIRDDTGEKVVRGGNRNGTEMVESGTFWDLCKTGILETKAQNVFSYKGQLNIPKSATVNNSIWGDEEEASTFSIFRMSQGRKNRPCSTNGVAVHMKETSNFRPGHNRSHSEISYLDQQCISKVVAAQQLSGIGNPCSRLSSNASSLDKSVDEVTIQAQNDKTFPNIVKKGYLETRLDHTMCWSSCYAELSPSRLRLHSLEASGNQHPCTVYPLSHFQSITLAGNHETLIVDAVFVNATKLQLKAQSPWEARDWGQRLWERVHALQLVHEGRLENSSSSQRYICNGDCGCNVQHKLSEVSRPIVLPININQHQNALKSGTLYKLTEQNNWEVFTFVLKKRHLVTFQADSLSEDPLFTYSMKACLAVQTDGSKGHTSCFQIVFPQDVLCLRAETEEKAHEWMEALKSVMKSAKSSVQSGQVPLRNKPHRDQQTKEQQKSKRQSVTTSFLGILTTLAVEKGLTAQSFRCAGKCLSKDFH